MSLTRLPLPSQSSKNSSIETTRGLVPWNSGVAAFLAPLFVGRVHSADLLIEYSLGLKRNTSSGPSAGIRLAFTVVPLALRPVCAGPSSLVRRQDEAVVSKLERLGRHLVAGHVEDRPCPLHRVDVAQAPAAYHGTVRIACRDL